MCEITEKFLKEAFVEYLEQTAEFEETAFEFKEYDASTEQVFLVVEGKWNTEVYNKVSGFFKVFNKRILVSKMNYIKFDKNNEKKI